MSQINLWWAEILRLAGDLPAWQAGVLLVAGNAFMTIRWLVKPQYDLARESVIKTAASLFVTLVLANAAELGGVLKLILCILAAIVVAVMAADAASASGAYAKRKSHPLVSTVVGITGLYVTIVAGVALAAVWTQSAWWHHANRNLVAGEAAVLLGFIAVLAVFGPAKVRYDRNQATAFEVAQAVNQAAKPRD